MDEQNVIHTYRGITLSLIKELRTDRCHSMDEPEKHAKWKKPDTKGHRLYKSTYRKSPE